MKRPALLLFVALSCRSMEEPVPPGAGMIGSWQCVERGYSPGAGYIIEKIPAKPVQRIDFLDAQQVRTDKLGNGLFASARSYRIDSTYYGPRIEFYDEMGKAEGQSMAVAVRNDTLRISPSCYEGCHYAFVRLR